MADRGNSKGRRLAGAAALCFLSLPPPATAQAPALPTLRVLPPGCEGSGGGDEIIVCGDRGERRSRFRIPEEPDTGFDPAGTVESVSRERNALTEAGAASGIGSCSNIGPGGFTGCRAQHFRRDIDQYGGALPSLRNGYRGRRR
ncbi:MAG TPA: hypothetical protein VGB08_11700 [Allosphingosinicella sp.]|jgi:hypothetical protein